MRFGVLAPMPSELRPVVKAFGLRRGRSGSLEGHVGRAGEADVVATTTGIGTELATTAAQRMLDRGEVDHVVVAKEAQPSVPLSTGVTLVKVLPPVV